MVPYLCHMSCLVGDGTVVAEWACWVPCVSISTFCHCFHVLHKCSRPLPCRIHLSTIDTKSWAGTEPSLSQGEQHHVLKIRKRKFGVPRFVAYYSLVIWDESGHTKFPFSFTILSWGELGWAVADLSWALPNSSLSWGDPVHRRRTALKAPFQSPRLKFPIDGKETTRNL